MNEALRRKFRERLFTVARERHQRAARGFGDNDPEVVRAELHALAGEAHMLGEIDLATAAGEGERAALGWRAGVGVERERVGQVLDDLAALLATQPPGPPGASE